MSEGIHNQPQRIETLKHIIRHLHEGQAPEQVRQQLVQIVRQTEPSEIMAMEQQLIDEGMPVQEIRSMCDLHSQVTRQVLKQRQNRPELPPGHPAETFKRENEALRSTIAESRTALAALRGAEPSDEFTPLLLRARQSFNYLMDVDKHYKRKEQVLFPCLERHGINGPSKVMWAKDDEIRALLAEAAKQLAARAAEQDQIANVISAVDRALASMEEMIYKEENILLPMALDTLTPEEWAEIWQSSPVYGWCLIEPGTGYKPVAGVKRRASDNPLAVTLATGSVSVEQLEAIFSTLPLDLTFVDADDRVAFYSEGPDRIFARSRAVIGRKVQYCHPVNSVDLVDRILGEFRAGTRDVAEFWISVKEKYLHIRFFAVRDGQRNYLGTLEFVQDIAPLQKITGERRLLAMEDLQPATA
jgi:DUF438 domain-containing protein